MEPDFTTVTDRHGTHSLKWDNVLPVPGQPDVIPLWVADMDFPGPPAVQAALSARVDHGIFGYTNLPAGYFESVSAWYARRYGRRWNPSDFVATPSVLHGLSMAVRALTKPGDRILNLPPIYYPFYKVAQLNGREIVDVPLVKRDRWEMDFGGIEAALVRCRDEGRPVTALLFSAPQNPTGRAWTEDELTTLGALARAFDLLILSDEIHSDLVQPGQRHRGPLDVPGLDDRTLVFTGPNKTFNLAGLPISHVYAANPGLRQKMKAAVEADFYDQPNVLSLAAAWAAYREGDAWLDGLLKTIAENKGVLDQFLAALSRDLGLEPTLRAENLEATYLAWVDVTPLVRARGFGSDKDLALHLETVARVKVTAGSIFRTGGENHLRFNLATPRSLLEEGLARIRKALS